MNLHFSQILEASCSHNVCPEPSLPGHRTPNPSIRGVGAPMDGLSALPWTARWCQGTLPCVLFWIASMEGMLHSHRFGSYPLDGLDAI